MNKRRWFLTILPLALTGLLLLAPGVLTRSDSAGTAEAAQGVDPRPADDSSPTAVSTAAEIGTGAARTVVLSGSAIDASGEGIVVNGGRLTITTGGTYRLSGTLNDGQVVVDAADTDRVTLVLDSVHIACSTSAAIHVVNADKVVIALADGSKNVVSDGAVYVFDDPVSDEPNAAIFSADDLTIEGTGSLTVEANYNNGIQSKDDLEIVGGTIDVVAVNDGLKGRDSVVVRDARITVQAGADGIQSNNDEDPEKGTVTIESGTIRVTAGEDGIQAETSLAVLGGDITITTGGGSDNSSSSGRGIWGGWVSAADSPSAKGLKAGINVTVSGGSIHIDSSDDAVHSNDTLTIDGGTFIIASGDDGMHADTELTINDGDITITKSYEGVESSSITVNGGTLHITSSDDGVNAAGGVDGSSIDGRRGQNPFSFSSDHALYVHGGTIVIDAGGDGFDINGPITMTDGVVLINGPTSNNNGALDYSGSFTISGGFLVAAGSAGMAQAPSAASTQNSVAMTFSSALSAGTIVHLETESGETILSFAPSKPFQSVVFSSAELTRGTTYVLYTGGTSAGSVTGGLYSDGSYTPGTRVTDFIVTGTVTAVGSSGRGFPGGGRTRPPGG